MWRCSPDPVTGASKTRDEPQFLLGSSPVPPRCNLYSPRIPRRQRGGIEVPIRTHWGGNGVAGIFVLPCCSILEFPVARLSARGGIRQVYAYTLTPRLPGRLFISSLLKKDRVWQVSFSGTKWCHAATAHYSNQTITPVPSSARN